MSAGISMGEALLAFTAGLWTGLVCRRRERGTPMGGKRYHAVKASSLRRIEFELVVERDGVDEVHRFVAAPRADAGDMVSFVMPNGDDDGRQVHAIFRMVSKTLVNDDGVPAQWVPKALERPKNAGESYQAKFRGPDGKLYTFDKVEQFTDPLKGSSRRRWNHLMFEDDDAVVDLAVVSEIAKDLLAEAAGRPTSASQPS